MTPEEKEDAIARASIRAAASGGLSGAALGAGASLFSPTRGLSNIVKNAGLAGLGMGAIAGGSIYAGSKILGPPTEEEDTGFTRRGGLGGLVAGVPTGALLGGLAGSGLHNTANDLLELGPNSVAKFIRKHSHSLTDNSIGDYFKKLGDGPRLPGMLKGAALGAGALGAVSAFSGGDEGLQLDFIHNEINNAAKRRGLLEDEIL